MWQPIQAANVRAISIWPHLVNSVKTSGRKLNDKTQTHQRLLIRGFSIFFLKLWHHVDINYLCFLCACLLYLWLSKYMNICILCSNKIYNWGITFAENNTFTFWGIENKWKSYKLSFEVIKKDNSFWLYYNLWQ